MIFPIRSTHTSTKLSLTSRYVTRDSRRVWAFDLYCPVGVFQEAELATQEHRRQVRCAISRTMGKSRMSVNVPGDKFTPPNPCKRFVALITEQVNKDWGQGQCDHELRVGSCVANLLKECTWLVLYSHIFNSRLQRFEGR
jgi:hypothetical protein